MAQLLQPGDRPVTSPARRKLLAETVRFQKSAASLIDDEEVALLLWLLGLAGSDGLIESAQLGMVLADIERRFRLLGVVIGNDLTGRFPDAASAGIELNHEQLAEDDTEAAIDLLGLAVLADDQRAARDYGAGLAASGVRGDTASRALARSLVAIRDNVLARLSRGITGGESLSAMTADLQAYLSGKGLTENILQNRVDRQGYGSLRARAWGIGRSQLAGVFAAAQLQWQWANRYVIGWQWTLGEIERHCPVCLARAGTIYKDDDVELGQIPYHQNCQCYFITIFGFPERPLTR